MKTVLRAGLLTALAAAGLFADVTYSKSMKFTGGTMLEMLRNLASNPTIGRMAGPGLAAALHDQTFTVYLKGSKMAQIGDPISTIYDLDAGTVTIMNNENRTYSVQSLDEMRQQIEHAQQRMSRSKAANIQFDVKVENTGHTRTLNGQSATETVMTLSSQVDSPYGHPVVRMSIWSVPVDSNTREFQEFSKRASGKMSSTLASLPPIFGGAGTALSSATQELQKLNGIPVLEDTAVTGVTTPFAAMGAANADPNAPVITIETQSWNFVSGPVDESKFAVPSDYHQEQPHR